MNIAQLSLYSTFIKVLGSEQFGQCTDYQAVPGFGLQCNISKVEDLLKEKRKLSDGGNVILECSDGQSLTLCVLNFIYKLIPETKMTSWFKVG